MLNSLFLRDKLERAIRNKQRNSNCFTVKMQYWFLPARMCLRNILII